jgi:uncharacterized protein YndB with AHSA1/START domain
MKSEVKMTDKQLQITRVFDAPRVVVFGYWKQAEKLERWSGCAATTKCQIKMDFRVGGSFTQKMDIAGAGEFTFTGQYDEIIEPERIVYHANMGPGMTTKIVLEFIELGKQTKMVMTQEGFPDQKMCKIVSEGTMEAFEKLDRVLAGRAATAG